MPYREYLLVLARRWWLLPLVASLAVASAFLFARGQTPLYRSTSRLVVTPGRPDLGQQLTVEKQLRPMAQRVKTTDIARQADELERFDLGAERLLGKIRAEAIIDQGLVQIDADDTDPDRAERIAGAFAQVFAQQHAAADVGRPQAERLNVDVLDRPSAATLIYPQTRVWLLAAGLIGVLGAILLSFGMEYMDNTISSADDVSRVLGMSTLARVPWQREEPAATGSVQPERPVSRSGQRVP